MRRGMVARSGRSLGVGVIVLSVFSLLVACTGSSTSRADAAAPARSVACAEGSAGPVGYDVAIDDTRTTLDSSPPLALIAPGKNRAPYLVRLHAETCGPRAQLAYAFTRLSTANDGRDLVAALGPPPGVAVGAAEGVAEGAPQRIEGTRAVVRGEEVVLGEGVWPDGERYRMSVTVR